MPLKIAFDPKRCSFIRIYNDSIVVVAAFSPWPLQYKLIGSESRNWRVFKLVLILTTELMASWYLQGQMKESPTPYLIRKCTFLYLLSHAAVKPSLKFLRNSLFSCAVADLRTKVTIVPMFGIPLFLAESQA